MSDASSFGLEG